MDKIYATKEELIADVGPVLYEIVIGGYRHYFTRNGIYKDYPPPVAVDVATSPSEARAEVVHFWPDFWKRQYPDNTEGFTLTHDDERSKTCRICSGAVAVAPTTDGRNGRREESHKS